MAAFKSVAALLLVCAVATAVAVDLRGEVAHLKEEASSVLPALFDLGTKQCEVPHVSLHTCTCKGKSPVCVVDQDCDSPDQEARCCISGSGSFKPCDCQCFKKDSSADSVAKQAAENAAASINVV